MRGKVLLEVLLGSAFALVALAAIASQISDSRAAQTTLRARAEAAFLADREVARLRTEPRTEPRGPGRWRVGTGWEAVLEPTARADLDAAAAQRLSVRRVEDGRGTSRRIYRVAP